MQGQKRGLGSIPLQKAQLRPPLGTRTAGFCTVSMLLVTGFSGLNRGPSALGNHNRARLRHKKQS